MSRLMSHYDKFSWISAWKYTEIIWKFKRQEMNLPKILTKPQCCAIKSILDGKDLLCVLPTGSAKTLCIIMSWIIKSAKMDADVSHWYLNVVLTVLKCITCKYRLHNICF